MGRSGSEEWRGGGENGQCEEGRTVTEDKRLGLVGHTR